MPMIPIYVNAELYAQTRKLQRGTVSKLVAEFLKEYIDKLEGVDLTEEELRKELLKEEILEEAKKKIKEIEDGTY